MIGKNTKNDKKNDGATAPRIIRYTLTDSTNTRAKEYAREHVGERECVIFIADGQTAGRGRLGRSFVSESGEGIFLSVLFYPDLPPEKVTDTVAYSAVILRRAISRVAGVLPSVKWVNDLYLGGKKLAGILCECVFSENEKTPAIIAGMGINVYKNAVNNEISDIATSIEAETNLRISREKLTEEIIEEFLENLSSIGSQEMLSEYRDGSFIIGKKVTVRPIAGEPYEARAVEILDDYSLLVEPQGGGRLALNSGEISVKLKIEG
ncbi:MAG: biotin--[acetyl-CoA-carboxylase] ligase [Clostridia bacterium]|nr:biotin--[acetyl-CoA-carboxylase] ligase [Clostridia bacterium]